MSTLKSIFPMSWKYAGSVGSLIVGILVHLVVEVLVGALISLAGMITGWIPVIGSLIGWALGIVSSLLGIYIFAGIILLILVFLKVLKD